MSVLTASEMNSVDFRLRSISKFRELLAMYSECLPDDFAFIGQRMDNPSLEMILHLPQLRLQLLRPKRVQGQNHNISFLIAFLGCIIFRFLFAKPWYILLSMNSYRFQFSNTLRDLFLMQLIKITPANRTL